MTHGLVVAVVGARGGAGTSTVAASLAGAAVRAHRQAALVDLDLSAGGIDVLLGIEDVDGLRWPDLAGVRGEIRAADLLAVLPGWRGVSVLSADRQAVAVDAGVEAEVVAALAAGCELVVLDLPRHRLTEGRPLPGRCDVVALVVPRDVRSVATANAIRPALQRCGAAVLLVVAEPAPGRLTPAEVADALGLPLAATLRRERGAGGGVERGCGPGGRGRGPVAAVGQQLFAALVRPAVQMVALGPARLTTERPVAGWRGR